MAVATWAAASTDRCCCGNCCHHLHDRHDHQAHSGIDSVRITIAVVNITMIVVMTVVVGDVIDNII